MEKVSKDDIKDGFYKLIKVVSKLRDPVEGCPWDKDQTHLSLIPYLIEEVYEVTDAIRHGDEHQLCDELGDLLLQIILHAQIALEEDKFSIKDITNSISLKLIRRHPHIFKEKKELSLDESQSQWKKIKENEAENNKDRNSTLSEKLKAKIRSRSPVQGTMLISKKTGEIGFEWKDIEHIFEKMNEEINELKSALKKNDKTNAQEEFGDILFTLINIARWLDINPEESLVLTNQKFLKRFEYIEKKVKGNINEEERAKIKRIWEEAKEKVKQAREETP